MNSTIVLAFSFSIVIAAVIGLARFGKILRIYQPFVYITIAGFISELTSFFCIKLYHSNTIVFNIYLLVECILWFWQFRRWKGFFKKEKKTYLLLFLLIAVWIGESSINGINSFNSTFHVLYSFCLVFLGINQVNELIVKEKSLLLRNAKFLICCGVIIFYTYGILVNSFYVFKLPQSDTFMANIYYILVFVNLFVNLLYALATLWIPTRQRFTLLS